MSNWYGLRIRTLLHRGFSGLAPAVVAYCLPVLLVSPLAMAADHFDVVSVKQVERPTGMRRRGPGRIRYEGIGFSELIRKAFALPLYQVVWPEWVNVSRDHPSKEQIDVRFFTIDATMPPETSAEEFRQMLQNLLVERFGLAFHRETRPLARYDLSFIKGGPKMAKAKPLTQGSLSLYPDDFEGLDRSRHLATQKLSFGKDFGTWVSGDYTVAGIAEFFSHYLRHPLVDQTGSEEYYAIDFTWDWFPYEEPTLPQPGVMNVASDGEARQLFSEMEKRLGLKATLRSVPMEFLVIDRLRHDATEN